jgi:hypothetical protein
MIARVEVKYSIDFTTAREARFFPENLMGALTIVPLGSRKVMRTARKFFADFWAFL